MAKGNILQDTFEQLAELGVSTSKKTVKSVAQTLNPLASPEKSSGDEKKAMMEKLKNQKNNHTPLDFKRLENQYSNSDSNKTDALRRHLFNLVKRGDEKTLMDSRQREMQKKRQEAYSDSENKRREDERKKSLTQGDDLPKGKQRKSIFSHKKTAEKQHTETKPSTGKQ